VLKKDSFPTGVIKRKREVKLRQVKEKKRKEKRGRKKKINQNLEIKKESEEIFK